MGGWSQGLEAYGLISVYLTHQNIIFSTNSAQRAPSRQTSVGLGDWRELGGCNQCVKRQSKFTLLTQRSKHAHKSIWARTPLLKFNCSVALIFC